MGRINRDAVTHLTLTRLGARRSAWNAADIRGRVEVLLTQEGLVAEPAVRIELAEDITARAIERCPPLLLRPDVPEHVRAYTSPHALEVEAEIIGRMARRADRPTRRVRVGGRGLERTDPTQTAAVGALGGRRGAISRRDQRMTTSVAGVLRRVLAGQDTFLVEPPVGIEPTTFSLRVRRSTD